MAALHDCPGLECWQALLEDRLPDEQRDSYERHLEWCAACQEHLDRTKEVGDGLRRSARRIGDPTATPVDPILLQALEQVRGGKSLVRVVPVEPADLYFLRPAERPDLLGTLGAYEVEEVIGQGGMGVVLKAFEPALHRSVAIKVMAPAVAGSVLARQRFTREAKAAAAVCHEHIVAVHAVHEADGLPYLVMQYVRGESLQTRLDRGGPLELVDIVRIGLQTAVGLAAAHGQGLIHRDIKPANLLLENGLARVKITDFGLARMADDVQLTQNGTLAGTPEYMAPEQARGEPVDRRADLFSVGSVLYAMCTGRPPFHGATTLAVLHQVNEEEPTPLRSLNPTIPAWLETLIGRLMAKDPGDRFQSAAEVAALLEGYLAHLQQPTTVSAPNLPSAPFRIWRKRPANAETWKAATFLLVALSAGLLILLLVGGWIAFGTGQGAGPVAAAGAADDTQTMKEYHRQFEGNPEKGPLLDLYGPDADQCVKFEPEGLRITLPTGYPGNRPDTGVITRFGVKGDFEITLSYQILDQPVAASGRYTRLILAVVPEKPQGTGVRASPETWHQVNDNMAVVQRQTGWNDFRALWQKLDEGEGRPMLANTDFRPARETRGSLRLVRTGTMLSWYVVDGPGSEFVLLHQEPYSGENIKNVRIVAMTGGTRTTFDVRVLDFHVQAAELPLPSSARLPKAERVTWPLWPFTLAAILSFVLVVPLGVWLYVRYRRLIHHQQTVVAARERTAEAPLPPLAFACSTCGKMLKAKAELAGKKVKCSQCGQPVPVPQSNRTAIQTPNEAGKAPP